MIDDFTSPARSNRLPASLIGKALHSGRDRRSGRAQRVDGWTPPRIRTFLEELARTGAVAKAARAVGMSRQSAYALRSSAKGQAFDDAWRRALLMAGPSIPDELMDRAMNGYVEPIYRNGKVWGERHRFDNPLAMRLLRQIDRLEASLSPAARAARAVAEDFDALLDVACSGDEDQFDTFLRARLGGNHRGATQTQNLSILPVDEEARREVAQTPNLSTLRGAETERQSSNLSTLSAERPSRSCSPAPGAIPLDEHFSYSSQTLGKAA